MNSSLATRITAIDFQNYIEQLTTNFTGRKWVFDRIDNWLKNQKERFFLLAGKPGVGKSAIAAQLTKQDIVKAYHFCRAGDVETIIPNRIFRSLAAQLDKKLPFYAEALANTIKPVHLSVEANIKIENMIGGQVTGVIINNLTTTNPEEELEILIRAPLAELPKIYAEQQKELPELAVILIDSLDEAVTTSADVNLVKLLASLSHSENFPSWVRFVLTSRPERQVLRQFEPLKPYELDDNSSDSRRDIEEYIQSRVQQEKLNQVLQNAQVTAQTLIDKISNLSSGNFLYTKLLLNDIEAERQPLDNLSALPKSIDEIYHNFLKRFNVDEWKHHYQPILGTLTVTQEPVTEEQLANFTGIQPRQLRQDLGVVRQFLAVVKDEKGNEAFAIFHQSLRDYLLDKERNQDFWCDAKEQHDLIAKYYKKDSTSWENVEWANADNYGLLHLPKHLNAAGREEELYALLTGSPNWMEAKFNAFSSDAAYVDDLELAIKKFSDPLKPSELLTLTKLYTARQVVHQRSSRYDDTDLTSLVWLGREAEAIGYVRLRPDAGSKFAGLLTIYEALQEKGQPNPDILDEAKKVADEINRDGAQAGVLQKLAVALARIKRFTEAEELAREIEVTSVKAEVLRELAVALAKAEDIEKAKEFFTQAEKLTRDSDIKNDSERIEALRELAVALAQANLAEKVPALLSEVEQFVRAIDENDLERMEALRKLAVALAQVGDVEKASAVFTEVEEFSRTIKEDLGRSEMLRQLAFSLAEAKFAEKARAVFSEVMEIPNAIEKGWQQTEVLREFAEILFRAGLTEDAKEVFMEAREATSAIEGNRAQAEALRNLAASLARFRFAEADEVFAEAEELAPTIENSQRESVLSKWAAALERIGLTDKAATIFTDADKVAQAALEIETTWREVEEKRLWAADLNSARDTAQASFYLKQVEELSQSATAISEAGNFTEVREAVRTFKFEAMPDMTLAMLALALSLAGYCNQAKKVARAIENDWERASALSELAETFAQIEQFAEAFNALGLINRASQFLDNLVDWVPAFEKVKSKLSVEILEEILRIFGWKDVNWREVWIELTNNACVKERKPPIPEHSLIIPSEDTKEHLEACIQETINILYRNSPQIKLMHLERFEKPVQERIIRNIITKIVISLQFSFEQLLLEEVSSYALDKTNTTDSNFLTIGIMEPR